MKYFWLVLVLGWSLFRGVGEGITMHFPNPREHPWFSGYHWFRAFEAGLLITAAVIYVERTFRRLFIAGVIILSLEAFEIAYMVSRFGQATAHENVLGLWNLDGSGAVLALHIARTLAGVLLTWRFK